MSNGALPTGAQWFSEAERRILDAETAIEALEDSGGGALPDLSPDPSGTFTAADITVDSKGRVTAASNGTGGGGVSSVNGETGAVSLSAADVGADPAGTTSTHAAVTTGAHGISAFGAGLVAAANAPAARTVLALGTIAVLDAAEFEEVGVAAGLDAAHVAAGDPHAQYQLESQKGAAGGYASLDGSTLVPTSQLGTGTADGTTFLRGDGTWSAPSGGGGLTQPQVMARSI